MGLFDKRIAYKPFEFPEYYTEGWLKQAQAFWLHTEISMQGDLKDWNEKLTKKEKHLVGNILKEKHLVGNILLGFAQTECAVSDYWTQKVVGWFPKHEIQQMAMMFGMRRVRLLDSEGCWMVSETRDPTNGNDVWFTRNYTCSCLQLFK
jgi:ribonucleoside-diphosphate reductase beta chain